MRISTASVGVMVLVLVALARIPGGTAGPAPCHEGDVVAQADADLAVLGGVRCLHGSLTIGGVVSSLRPLRRLTEIQGDLSIKHAERLASLRGLDALARVGGSVSIGGPKQGVARLRVVDGLPKLREIGGNLRIAGGYIFRPGRSLDAPIRGVSGLAALVAVAGDVVLFDLDGFRGLNALASVGGDLTIEHGDFAVLGGLRRLARVGGSVRIVSNPRLSRIAGLGALVEIGGDVEVTCGASEAAVRRRFAVALLEGRLRGIPDESVAQDERPPCRD